MQEFYRFGVNNALVAYVASFILFYLGLIVHWIVRNTGYHFDVAAIFLVGCWAYNLIFAHYIVLRTLKLVKLRKQWLKEMHERRSTPYKFFF